MTSAHVRLLSRAVFLATASLLVGNR